MESKQVTVILIDNFSELGFQFMRGNNSDVKIGVFAKISDLINTIFDPTPAKH